MLAIRNRQSDENLERQIFPATLSVELESGNRFLTLLDLRGWNFEDELVRILFAPREVRLEAGQLRIRQIARSPVR
jgi:hypothetical protein